MNMRSKNVPGGWLVALALACVVLAAGGCATPKPKTVQEVDLDLIHRAQARYAEGRHQESLELYAQSISEGETVPARMGAGIVMMAMDRPAPALREFNRVVLLAPGLADGHANRGLALAALGRGSAAEGAFEDALRLDPDHAAALNGMGCLLLDEDEVEKALVRFSAALKAEPNNPEIHYNRALGFYRVGLHTDAVAELDRSLELRPGHAPALAMRGVARLAQDDAEAALADLDAALELEPEVADYYYNRGLARQRLMDYQGAIDDYTRAMVRDPAQAVYYVNRGESLILSGVKRGGCEDVERACDLGRCERLKALKAGGMCTE